MAPGQSSSYSVSSAVRVSAGRGRGGKNRGTMRRVRDAHRRSQVASQRIKGAFAGLDYDAREELASMDVDVDGWEDDPTVGPIPPGDEGVLASHAGGDIDLCMNLLQDKGKRYDGRSRRDRTSTRNAQWAVQISALTDAYLSWRSHDKSGTSSSTGSSTPDVDGRAGEPPIGPSVPSGGSDRDSVPAAAATGAHTAGEDTASAASSDIRAWHVFIIDFFTTSTSSFTPSSPLEIATVTLANNGYLAVSPVYPTMAVSFLVLEAYRQLHGACPRLSINAFCQALCGLHLALYRHTFAEQFSIAFDVYLDILHAVDNRVSTALARDTPNWRMLNACAPCLYKLENEAPLTYDFLAAMDGNSSLKLVDDSFRSGTARSDDRTGRTDLFLSPEQVDRFKDEVHNAQQTAQQETGGPHNPYSAFPPSETRQPAPPGAEMSGVGVDVDVDRAEEPADSKTVCADRWRNAGPEARKKMFSLFQATGIFIVLCRHGHVLVMCDMIRSGELMKYPLAMVDKLIEVYGPNKIKLGYDIGCVFSKTMSRSSVGPRAEDVISCVVPAFHGHSHNRGCQVMWHPLYMDGVGKEDFEGSERLFSWLNAVAGGTRLATPFHRHQAIEGAIGFWNQQKHIASGKFIYQNYRQALQIIEQGNRDLAVFASELKTSEADYERYLQEERAYLRTVRSEPLELTLKCQYVEALQELESERIKDVAAIEAHRRLDYMIIHEGIVDKQIRAIEREYLHARDRVARAEDKARRLEELLDVPFRWLPTGTEYKAVAQELTMRKYRRAIDNLEHLVVQRLFELKKLGMNGVGYKQREKIGQALKSRAQAIRTALATYNKEAAKLSPPRSQLSWTDVMNMVCIGEFDLLRDARTDIRQEDWAKPRHREAMNVYFNMKRAREEIRRADVEIGRLFTAMVDEHVDYVKAIEAVRETNPALSQEIARRHRYQNVLHAHVVEWLTKASALRGFSGRVAYGQRVGRDSAPVDMVPLPPWATRTGADSRSSDAEDDGNDDDDDDANDLEDGEGIPGVGGAGTSGRFVQFVDRLSGDHDDY